jgi:hypothetical protein
MRVEIEMKTDFAVQVVISRVLVNLGKESGSREIEISIITCDGVDQYRVDFAVQVVIHEEQTNPKFQEYPTVASGHWLHNRDGEDLEADAYASIIRPATPVADDRRTVRVWVTHTGRGPNGHNQRSEEWKNIIRSMSDQEGD